MSFVTQVYTNYQVKCVTASKENLISAFKKIYEDTDALKEFMSDFADEAELDDSVYLHKRVDADLADDFKKFIAEFKQTANFVGSRLTIFREIKAEKIDFNHLGIFWSWEKDAAESYWSGGDNDVDDDGDGDDIEEDNSLTHLISGHVDMADIDMYSTLASNLLSPTEKEIRLTHGSTIYIDGKAHKA